MLTLLVWIFVAVVVLVVLVKMGSPNPDAERTEQEWLMLGLAEAIAERKAEKEALAARQPENEE